MLGQMHLLGIRLSSPGHAEELLVVAVAEFRLGHVGFEFRQADIAALIGRKLAYIVLLYCLASHPIQFERRSVILGLLLRLGQC